MIFEPQRQIEYAGFWRRLLGFGLDTLMVSVITSAISLALLYRNPGLSSYEVFGTAFRLEGSNFQFALLAIILLSSLFLYRPWCRHLCPLHKNATEGLFDNTRRIARTAWQKLTKRPKRLQKRLQRLRKPKNLR